MHMCEIFVDGKFIAHFVRSQVTELREDRLFMFEDEAAWNLCKKRSFGQFLICIQIQDSVSIQDSNPHPKSGFKSGVRIRIRIRNFCFGSATLVFYSYITFLGGFDSLQIYKSWCCSSTPITFFGVFQIWILNCEHWIRINPRSVADPHWFQCRSGYGSGSRSRVKFTAEFFFSKFFYPKCNLSIPRSI